MKTESQSMPHVIHHQQLALRKRRRAVVFWLFLLASIPIAILTVGYASGYRFNEQTNALYTSGGLTLRTTPQDAVVLLNSQQQEQRTPFVQTLPPGEYNVLIQKEGYAQWAQRASLTAGRSAIFDEIILFLQQPASKRSGPMTAHTEEFRELTPNEQQKYSISQKDSVDSHILTGPRDVVVNSQNDSALLFASESSDNIETPLELAPGIIDAEWNKSVLLYITEFELWIYDLSTNETTLVTRQSIPFIDATWHPNGHYVFFSTTEGITALEFGPHNSHQRWLVSTLQPSDNLVTSADGQVLSFNVGGGSYDLTLYE